MRLASGGIFHSILDRTPHRHETPPIRPRLTTMSMSATFTAFLHPSALPLEPFGRRTVSLASIPLTLSLFLILTIPSPFFPSCSIE